MEGKPPPNAALLRIRELCPACRQPVRFPRHTEDTVGCAAEIEREECAKIVEFTMSGLEKNSSVYSTLVGIAAAIRRRK